MQCYEISLKGLDIIIPITFIQVYRHGKLNAVSFKYAELGWAHILETR